MRKFEFILKKSRSGLHQSKGISPFYGFTQTIDASPERDKSKFNILHRSSATQGKNENF